MRTQFMTPHIRAGSLMLTTLACFLAVLSLQAQDLIHHLGHTPQLDQQQEHYLRWVTENPINENVQFVEINLDALKGDQLTFNPTVNQKFPVYKADRGSNTYGMSSWCGRIPGYGIGDGDVNMVRSGIELVGHFTVDNMIYAVTHIGNGLHVLYEVNSAATEAEQCHSGQPDDADVPTKKPTITDADYLNNISEEKASGDCRIRVLIGFTPAASIAVTNILAQLNNLINLANAAYDFAAVNFNIEMASAYRVAYTESGSLNTDLSRWRATGDGFMDEVHTRRTLWRADQCALIVSGGGGIAYLSLAYGNQFSVTGTGNFNVFTFHHELGHNMLCTHDLINTDQPGTAPYAGWGNPQGCFRTIMAYQQACGTGICPRVNIFSRSIGTYTCGGTSYVIGGTNNRNRDRLVLSRNSVINHEISPTSAVYGSNYLWISQEAVHMAANLSFSYSGVGSNLFELRSGSEGSFRATNFVNLGEGFWARSGTFFEAYLDDCPALLPPDQVLDPAEETVRMDDMESPLEIGEMQTPEHQHGASDVNVFPNPFKQTTFVEFETHDFDQVSITMYDMMGKVVIQALHKMSLSPGMHRVEIDTANLPSGMYMIAVEANGDRVVKRVVKNR